jgi:hypothetical protein
MPELQPGAYRHYKGNLYEVLGAATHSETDESLVVYRALYGGRGLWVRPLAMFQENVELDGQSVRRFAPIDGSGDFAVSAEGPGGARERVGPGPGKDEDEDESLGGMRRDVS